MGCWASSDGSDQCFELLSKHQIAKELLWQRMGDALFAVNGGAGARGASSGYCLCTVCMTHTLVGWGIIWGMFLVHLKGMVVALLIALQGCCVYGVVTCHRLLTWIMISPQLRFYASTVHPLLHFANPRR